MEIIRLYKNVRFIKIGLLIICLTMFFQVYFMKKEGMKAEYIFSLCFLVIVWLAGIIGLRNKRPVVEISARGISSSYWKNEFIQWEDIRNIDFHILGRNTRTLRFETVKGTKDIIVKATLVDPDQLRSACEQLMRMPHQERVGYIRNMLAGIKDQSNTKTSNQS